MLEIQNSVWNRTVAKIQIKLQLYFGYIHNTYGYLSETLKLSGLCSILAIQSFKRETTDRYQIENGRSTPF